jgi:8-oxo-dGTP pyrophosphatase MutT (NUDIX family)
MEDPAPLRHAAVIGLILPPAAPPDPVSQAARFDDAPRLLLIERAAGLRSHAGQLAFPGGKPEPVDTDLLATALREAREEVGLDPHRVQILGRLDSVPTPSGFMIVPYVGRVDADWTPRCNSSEVRRVLTPSLARLAEPSIHRVTDRRSWRGRVWELHEYAIADPPLWGATARMVWDLLRRLGTP